ncbi:phytanoyl-CoA dioxygenase family protein [Candidatus Pelagibacter sp.]|nr:phytanoyl-CoA dioxygenase family protein [Candidatus Pelagibacter sp.]
MQEKVNYFKRNGFVIFQNAITKNQIETLIKEVEKIKIKALKTKNNRYFHLTSNNKINTIHNIQKFYKSKVLTNLAKNSNIQEFLKIVLSKNIYVRNLEFFLKPKKTGMASPLHQDNFFWNIADSKAINVWVALSDANKRNGGIFYLKKSHKIGLINHVPSYMKGTSQTIPLRKIRKNKLKKFYPDLKKGDCVMHHCEVIHGSDRNLSNKDRVGIAISYKNRSSKINLKSKKLYEKKVEENLKTIYYK